MASVTFFLKKMILVKKRYKRHDLELLAIIEILKKWQLYLEGCKYEFLVQIDHHNLQKFIDTKNLSLR